MNIFTSNINKLNEDIESFVVTKNKIEKHLIESKKLKEKMSVQDFLQYLDFEHSNIYVDTTDKKQTKSICFRMYKIKNDMIIVYASEFDNLTFLDDLKSIDYDIKKLNKINQLDFMQKHPDKYFLINNELYIL